MRYCRLLFFLMMATVRMYGQANLVPNGNFNQATTCANWAGNLPRVGWNLKYLMDHSRVDTCGYEIYLVDDTLGRDKSGCTSMVTYSDGVNDFRYFASTQLSAPLVAGKQYYFEMYLKLLVDTTSMHRYFGSYYLTNNQGMGLTRFPLNFSWNANQPLPVLKEILRNDLLVFNEWTKISGCFIAEGGERYLSLGNFSTDAATLIRNSDLIPKPSYAVALYLVDDVYLTTFDLQLPGDTLLCATETLTLDATFSEKFQPRYSWSTGEVTPQIVVSKTGKYQVAVNLGVGCAFTDSVNVTSIPDPGQLNRTTDTTFCENIPLVLLAGADVPDATVVWNDGSTEKEKTVITPGDYSARISVRCGSWTETYRVQQADCKIRMFFPNAFSPNGDLLNETFFPVFDREKINIRNWNFEIFDRWGVLVFRSNDPDKLWDGRILGHDAQEGIYVWRLVYEGQKNNGISTDEQSGTVFLMR